MLKKSYLLTILAAFVLVFTSCDKDKDKDGEVTPRIDVSQLEKNEWKVTGHIVTATGQEDYDAIEEDYGGDIFASFDGEGEYYLTTESNGSSEFDGSYDVKDEKITWDFPLSIMGQLKGEEESTYTIDKLDKNTFKIVSTATINKVKVTETITFSAE
ncbi:hypothetical protein [Rufibacter tibetensis]|uniref:Lipocalin-like domain-containing protein n=1 Tax=Rufibacter tibetensis TaxID=512763 RepID=A0A0N7HWF4_9BACT|nr:hypothetical protein [Rufibacter tibetensis]ALI99096.1 hypothetical protein DC20_09055 [Rufibacter tibetensis]